jgi:hypothetical protein
MKTLVSLLLFMLAAAVAFAAPKAKGQSSRPYLGYIYPAGGQQGTTFAVKVGGQSLDDVTDVVVTGAGVTGKAVQCFKRIGPQEMTLLRDQLRELKEARKSAKTPDPPASDLIARIEKRIAEYCQRPASAALAGLVFLEFTIAPDAPPGKREVRLVVPGGVSNPLPFHVGQLPETTRKPMLTAEFQVLGKEQLALRKRPDEEAEIGVTPPCTLNGQIASGEINRYRFAARKGQQLVVSALARQLIPFIADAVPGWFQPVLALYNDKGKEIAYQDDFRFKPDPVVLFEVPKDGEYVAAISDAIHRGREDFVYRITIGEQPYLTSIFPLGGQVGETHALKMQGWNLDGATLRQPAKDAAPGVQSVSVVVKGVMSNAVPFALDTLPETLEKEPNNAETAAQKVTLPVIVNGRIDRKGDWDVFEFQGKAGDTLMAEVIARRLDSPMDPVLKITGANGTLLAFNDDHEDAGNGVNTHHADSYATVKLPADGVCRVHIGDTVRSGGDEYGYRLRIGPARPDFALRTVPSSVTLRTKTGGGSISVYVARKDGFAGPITIGLKNPPAGVTCKPVTISGTQTVARLSLKCDLPGTSKPFDLVVTGSTSQAPGQSALQHDAVPCEDRMQAFLWRHLVPAPDLKAVVYDPANKPSLKRVMPPPSPQDLAEARKKIEGSTAKFTKTQVTGRLRQIEDLYQEGLLTDAFASKRVAECTVQE